MEHIHEQIPLLQIHNDHTINDLEEQFVESDEGEYLLVNSLEFLTNFLRISSFSYSNGVNPQLYVSFLFFVLPYCCTKISCETGVNPQL